MDLGVFSISLAVKDIIVNIINIRTVEQCRQ